MSVADEDVARLRLVFGRMSRVLNREAEAGGISRTELSVLALVARLGPIGVGELAELEAMNPTMLSRIVGKLDDAGLLRRFPDSSDRRIANVEVTRQGRETHEQLRRQRARVLASALHELSPEHRDLVLQALPALEALSVSAQNATASASAARTNPARASSDGLPEINHARVQR